MTTIRSLFAIVALGAVTVACGSSSGSGFNETAAKNGIASSGLWKTDADRADALDSIRHTCELPDNSINDFSAHDFLVNDKYSPALVAAWRTGCDAKFVHVQAMIDNGDCFGGVLAGCKN